MQGHAGHFQLHKRDIPINCLPFACVAQFLSLSPHFVTDCHLSVVLVKVNACTRCLPIRDPYYQTLCAQAIRSCCIEACTHACTTASHIMIPDALRQQLQLLLEHQPIVKQIIQYLPSDLQRVAGTPEGLVALLLTAAVGLLVLLALAGTSKSKKGSSILLAGPMNAGKSTMYYQLVDGSQHNGLVASMEQNTGGTVCCTAACRMQSCVEFAEFRYIRSSVYLSS